MNLTLNRILKYLLGFINNLNKNIPCQKICKIIDLIEKRSFLIISFFFFLSYWFFSFFVLLNDGTYWGHPLSIPHHPFNLAVFDEDFFGSILYNFSQMPFYSMFTWLMLKTDPANGGFIGYIIFHHILGYYAIFCIYRILNILNVNKLLITIALSIFVFNPSHYFFFSHGWYGYPSMCLISIVIYHFFVLVREYNKKHILSFLLWFTILVAYRSIFHPLLFMVPTIIGICIIHKRFIKKTLLYSIIPLFIGFFPYVKNYIIFDSFSPALGSFAMAYKSQTFQYVPNEKILPYVKEGKISPLVFCFNAFPGFEYNGDVYSIENCKNKLPKKLLADEIEQLRNSNENFKKIKIITDSEDKDFNISWIPNSISGVVLGQQILKDAKAYYKANPDQRLYSIKNNLSQYFRTSNAYQFIIAVNTRNYPMWFGSPKWNLDFFKINSPDFKWKKYDMTSRPLIILFILLPLIFSFFYACGIKQGDKRFYPFYLYSLAVISIILFSKIYSAPFKSYIATLTFAIPLIGIFVYNLISKIKELDYKMISIGYIAGTCLYFMGVISLIVSSEHERYRFATDGLSLILFLFFIDKVIMYIKENFNKLNKLLNG